MSVWTGMIARHTGWIFGSLLVACTATRAPAPPPVLVNTTEAFATATCVDGLVFASGATVPANMRLLSTVLEPTDERADFVLRGACAVHQALLACPSVPGSTGPLAVVIAIEVDEDGKVVEATRQEGSVGEDAYSECVSAALRSASFPKRAQGKALLRIARATSLVTIAEQDPWIAGVVPSETKRVLRASFPRLRSCYEQRLRRPGSSAVQGLVTFRLTVRADGSFSEVAVDHDDAMADPEMLQCMAQVMTSLRVPSPSTGHATIRYPLRFATHHPP